MDQLNRIFSTDDTTIPDQVVFLHATEGSSGQNIIQQLFEQRQACVVVTFVGADVKAAFSHLSNKIQKFCNCNAKAPSPIKLAILGSDAYINSVLRFYVETLSSKPPEWQNYVRFYPIPLSSSFSTFAKYLGSIDPVYYSNFCNGAWKDFHEGHLSSFSSHDVFHRITNYLTGATFCIQIPVAEAMIMYKEKSHDEECIQVFIPFICDVKIGIMEGIGNFSLDDEKEAINISSSSPPNSSVNNSHIEKSSSLTSPVSSKDLQQGTQLSSTPPNSPSITLNMSNTSSPLQAQGTIGLPSTISSFSSQPYGTISNQTSQPNSGQTSAQQVGSGGSSHIISPSEPMDLQIDYWPTLKSNEGTKKADSSKFTLKNTFRTLHISRLPIMGEFTHSPTLTLSYITKEKKQKSKSIVFRK